MSRGWALLVAALLLGVGTAWFLWRHEDALGERDRREFSIVGACLVAEAPFVKFGWEMNGLLGCLGGWGLGVVVMGPIVLAGAAVVSSRCMRAATWGTTAVGLQMAIVSMCVGAWMYAAGFAATA